MQLSDRRQRGVDEIDQASKRQQEDSSPTALYRINQFVVAFVHINISDFWV